MTWQQALGQGMAGAGPALGRAWRRFVCGLSNFRRWLFQYRLPDYVVFTVDGELHERVPTLPRWYIFLPSLHVPLSLEYLDGALRRIAQDPDVKGILFLVKSPQLSLAQAQSMADLFRRFRQWDVQYNAIRNGIGVKQIVVHLEQVDTAAYVMAGAADRIYVPPLTDWSVLGLRFEALYLRDTLDKLGIAVDVVKIAPWKSAYDRFSQAQMSAADREQREWLLDSWFGDIVSAISRGRSLPEETVCSLIDRAPFTAKEALAEKLVDGIAYEDELPTLLGRPGREARLARYTHVHKLLQRRPQRRHGRAVGVLDLSGTIVPGKSRNFPIELPLFGSQLMGSSTVQQLVRAAMEDDRLAAIVLYVNSGGGSALASDLMWREIALLARTKPVVVYMGDVAASGGYYVALPAARIVAQPATITGSIGVVTMKPITRGTYEKAQAHRIDLQRGANADIYTDSYGWSEAQREQVEKHVRYTYHEFKERVAQGRHLDYEELDAICSGKVWTGKQALAYGLVDHLGDFDIALAAAWELADLPADRSVPTLPVQARRTLLARSAHGLGLVDPLSRMQDLGALASVLLRRDWEHLLGREHTWLMADGVPRLS